MNNKLALFEEKEIRKVWKESCAQIDKDYAILTNEIYKYGFGFND